MADIPVEETKQSLLQTSLNTRKPVVYKNFNLSYSSIQDTLVCEYERIVYTLTMINDSTCYINYYNLIEEETGFIGSFSKSSIDNLYPISILADSDHIYISTTTSNRIYIYDLNSLTISKNVNLNNATVSGRGKMLWYDNARICMLYTGGFALFDTTTVSWENHDGGATITTAEDFCLGKRYLMTTTYRYDFENNTFTTYVLPDGTAPTAVCYSSDDKIYYIGKSDALYPFNEETGTWGERIDVPWKNPFDMQYEDDVIYALQTKSDGTATNNVFIWDLKKNSYQGIRVAWSIPVRDADNKQIVRPILVRNVWYILRNTLAAVTYKGAIKYAIGAKYHDLDILFNEDILSDIEFDDRFVSIKRNHLEVSDGNITYPDTKRGLEVEVIDEERKLVAVSISKDDYAKIRHIQAMHIDANENEET